MRGNSAANRSDKSHAFAKDSHGNEIVLLDRIWEKILADHVEFIPFAPEKITAVLRRARRYAANHPHRRRLIAPDPLGITKWVVVVVDYGSTPARIVTIYPQSRDPKEEDAL